MVRLQIRLDGLDEDSRLLWWLQKNILSTAGLRDGEYSFEDTDPAIPLLLMCKAVKEDKLLPQYLGIKSVADHHGHIQPVNGRLVGVTYHPQTVIANCNLLPIVAREINNLLRASQRVQVLDRPKVSKGYVIPYREGKEFICDLEWNVETDVTTVVGLAYSATEAHSTYNTEDALGIVRRHLQAGTQVMGHNCVEADLSRVGTGVQSYKPEHVFDTKVAAHLVHAHLAETGLLDLGSMCRFYFPTREWKLDKTDLLTYNGYDCAYNYRLADALKQDLTSTDQWHLMEKQQRLAYMAYKMQEQGIRIDREELWKYAKQRETDKKAAKDSFGFNPNSNKQSKLWIGDSFGITVKDCRFETISRHRGKDSGLDRFIDYRDDNKSLSTWFPLEYQGKGKKKVLTQIGGGIKPHHNVTGTAVARFSCAGPNVQNIPPHLRKFLIPPDGYDMWVFDAKNLESRTVAWHAQDWDTLELWKQYDPYVATAANLLNKRAEEVTVPERKWAKTLELALLYGKTPYALTVDLKCKLPEARKAWDLYFDRRPKVRTWHAGLEKKFFTSDVMFRNPFGRVRFVYESKAHEFKKRAGHFQGCSSGADHINQCALDIWDSLGILPCMIVHDDFTCWLPKGEQGLKQARQIKEIMQRPIVQMPLPGGGYLAIPIEAKCGPSYGEVKEVAL